MKSPLILQLELGQDRLDDYFHLSDIPLAALGEAAWGAFDENQPVADGRHSVALLFLLAE